MYTGGAGAAYGYGQVHREFPQAQVEQQGQRPGAAITAPLDATQPPPWAVLLETWAALNAVAEVVYAVESLIVPGPKTPSVPLSDWQRFLATRAALDWVRPTVQLERPHRIAAGPPPIAFPALGQWTPTAPPLDATFYSFRLPLAPVTGPAVGPEAWLRARSHTAALEALQAVVYLVDPRAWATQPPAVAFPRLGQWVPPAEDPRVPWRVVLPRIPPLPGLPPRGPAGQWTPTTPDLDRAYASYRLRLAAVGPPVALPAIWPLEVENWAALNATSAVLYLVGAREPRIGGDQVAFPKLGQWTPLPPDPTQPYRVRLPIVTTVIPPLGIPAWEAERDQFAALMAQLEAVYLTKPGRVAGLAESAVPFPASWEGPRDLWAALGATRADTYLVARAGRLEPSLPPTPAWESIAQTWAAVDARAAVLYLVQRSAPPVLAAPAFLPTWMGAQRQWAALNATLTLVYLAERAGRIEPSLPAVPPWRASQQHWAALDVRQAVVYLTGLAEAAVREAPPFLPRWMQAQQLWAALNATLEVTAQVVRGGRLEPSLPPLPPWVLAQRLWGALDTRTLTVLLARLGLPAPAQELPRFSPGARAQQVWAALHAVTEALFLERPAQQINPPPGFVPPWLLEQRLWAAMTNLAPPMPLARVLGIVAPVGFEPPWVAEQERWAALGATASVVYRVRPETPVVPPPPLVPPWKAPRDLGAAYERLPARSLFWQPARYLPFVPVVIDYTKLGLVGVTVTNLRANAIPLPPLLGGLVEETDPKLLAPGSIADGENFAPQRAPRLAARGGSRVMLTLHDDAGSPAELSHVLGCAPKAATGAVLIGWSAGTTKHYGYAVTSDMAFAGASEALSRTPFPASWNRATPTRPVVASLFEKLYVADATIAFANRNPMAVIDAVTPPGITVPTFAFVAGGNAAAGLSCYCLEEYNNVLFIAGYGDEETGTGDDPALVRHSFLGQAPDAAAGFDKDAYNTIGSKGDRVTAMKKGRGLLVIAKANELYRVTGAGRAYPGWQYQVEGVHNTLGVGVENPLALEHAEGYWFGMGKQGPFRTDGYEVDPLVGPRQRTWGGIDQLGMSWVRYHPERRLVLFGVHVVAGAPDATYPWVILTWDCTRNVWQPNWKLAGTPRFFVGQAIATTTAQGPGAPPSAPNSSGITDSGYTGNWTNGDATAETEFWEQDVTGGGAYALVDVVAAGTANLNRVGRTSHRTYKWKVRHRKNGVYSPFTADTTVQTLIAHPNITLLCGDDPVLHTMVLTVTVNSPGTELRVDHSTDNAIWTRIFTQSNAHGAYDVYDENGAPGHYYRAYSHDGAWPTQDSTFQLTGLQAC